MNGQKMILFGVLVLFLAVSLSNVSAETSEIEIKGFRPLTTGDFFDYEGDITHLVQSLVEDEESSTATYKDVSTKFKTTVGGTETIKVTDKDIECYIVQTEVLMKFTIFDETEEYEWKYDSSSTGKKWISKTTFNTVMSEDNMKTKMTFTYGSGDSVEIKIMESEMVTVNTFTKIDETNPFPLKVGKTWSTLETYTSNKTEKSREKYNDNPYSEWEFTYSEDTVTETTNYEILLQTEVVTPAGTFDALKIKKQVVGKSEYQIDFIDRFGMNVQNEKYEDSSLSLILKLKSWKYEAAKDTDNENKAPFIEIIGITFVAALVSLVMYRKKR